jgi:hypothetical protein
VEVGYHAAFTITDLRVHDPDFGVHDGPILAFTMRRSSCSPWTDASSYSTGEAAAQPSAAPAAEQRP